MTTIDQAQTQTLTHTQTQMYARFMMMRRPVNYPDCPVSNLFILKCNLLAVLELCSNPKVDQVNGLLCAAVRSLELRILTKISSVAGQHTLTFIGFLIYRYFVFFCDLLLSIFKICSFPRKSFTN